MSARDKLSVGEALDKSDGRGVVFVNRCILAAGLLGLGNIFFSCALADEDFDSDLDNLIQQEAYWGNTVDASPRQIRVTIDGISNGGGKLNVVAYDDASAFAQHDFLAAAGLAETAAQRGSVELELTVKGTGPYALFVHHDEDNDKHVDMSNGKPLEGVGYSGWIDPYRAPSFDESAIVENSARVRLTYYRKDLRLQR